MFHHLMDYQKILMSFGKVCSLIFLLFFFFSDIHATNKKKIAKFHVPKSSIVIDFSDRQKVLFSEKPDAIRHPASLTKLMTVYLLFEALRSKKIDLNTKFKVSKFASNQPPTRLGLKVGEKIEVKNIIKALLVKSANDVAVVAAEGICGDVKKFATMMNKKAKQLGMHNTHFENSSGLPNKLQVTTARDIATLGISLFKIFPQYWYYFKLKSFQYLQTTHQTHCKILKWYKGSDGAKTGYTCASGFNLFVTAQKYNKRGDQKRLFVVVIGGNTSKARDVYSAQLMDRFFGDYKISTQNAVTISSKNKARKQNRALLSQIDKSETKIIERILEEDEEINIEKVLDYSADEKMNINELYVYDEEFLDGSLEIIDEEIIKQKSKSKKKITKKKTSKKRNKM